MNNPKNTLHHPPPPEYPTTGDPLTNLAAIQTRLNSLSHTLSNSVNANTPLPQNESATISAELSTAILHIIINGASLIAASHIPKKSDGNDDDDDDDELEIIELDVEELTADHTHTCEFCGKGFKRDANLRMHMRAHGDEFKTLKALTKPNNHHKGHRKTRFSCPYIGCDRNKKHKRFRALKSAVCVKNHFKRIHCAKMYSCNKCNEKRFSVLADLKRHMKNCEAVENKKVESCSCGVNFGSKDELFKHVSLLDGHMPADSSNNNVHGFGLNEDDEGFKDLRLWSSIEDILNFY